MSETEALLKRKEREKKQAAKQAVFDREYQTEMTRLKREAMDRKAREDEDKLQRKNEHKARLAEEIHDKMVRKRIVRTIATAEIGGFVNAENRRRIQRQMSAREGRIIERYEMS